MAGAVTRAAEAGKQMARGIVEMVHLMYQNNTALSFLESLNKGIFAEMKRRGWKRK